MASNPRGPDDPTEFYERVNQALGQMSQSERIRLFSFNTPQMRAFHLSWLAAFMAFFGWFGVAPLMAVVRDDLELTQTQVGNTIIASVALVIARPIIGWLCDRFGPRLTYTGLLLLGAIPVMGIGLSQNYETFLLFRLAASVIGASLVITQYHTSIMFAPNVVGAASGFTAGWGNLGSAAAQIIMPLILAAVMLFGASEFLGWRIAMIFPGAALLMMAAAYYLFAQDTPYGSYSNLRANGRIPPVSGSRGSFMQAARDYRVWVLFLAFGACLGVDLTINNIAALYFHDQFGLSIGAAGLIAGLFGLTGLFARPLGGIAGDWAWAKFGNRAKVAALGAFLLLEGLSLILFARMTTLPAAVAALLIFSLFVQISKGATFSVVPFINRRAMGSVVGIVGSGGNIGALAFGFLFRATPSTQTALLYVGIAVTAIALLVLLLRFRANG